MKAWIKAAGCAALGFVTGCVDMGTEQEPTEDDSREHEPSGKEGTDASTEAPVGPDTSDAIACPTPEDSSILDFTHLSGDGVQASFGDFVETFSGGTFVYPNTEQMTMYPLTSDVTQDNWHITGTVGEYSGFGLYFENCTKFDASAFDGIEFTISGDVGLGTTVDLRVGTAANSVSHEWLHENGQADEPANFGRCIPPGSNQYDGSCSEPHFTVTVTESPSVVTVLWDDLTGGSPEASVTPSELTSISWALPAPAGVDTENVTTYSVDLVVDDLRFSSQ
jgi:hypothetical protein